MTGGAWRRTALCAVATLTPKLCRRSSLLLPLVVLAGVLVVPTNPLAAFDYDETRYSYDVSVGLALNEELAPIRSVAPTGRSEVSIAAPGPSRGHVYGLSDSFVAPSATHLDEAASAANGVRLNAQLAADEIAGGHAYVKHVVERGEFPGIQTRAQFADMIETVITDYSDIAHMSGGRTAYWRDGVVVIRHPSAVDGGTAFVPTDGYAYFETIN